MWYDCQRDSHTPKQTNFIFYRLRNGLQQWTGIHTARQAVKGPEKNQNVSIFIKYNNRPNLLRQRKRNNNKQANEDIHWTTGFWLGRGT